MGRAWKVSNPNTGTATAWTQSSYDTLGRVLSVTHPDGSADATSYTGVNTPVTAEAATLTDPKDNKRILYRDALGRVTRVDEAPTGSNSPLNYTTSYQYTVLDDLKQVTQGSQTRTFDYDSLRRLRQAANPESGTVTYGYDQNGNLTSRGDARASFTSTYDALDRLTKKTYTGVTTPEENRCYDGKLYVGTACSGSAVSGELGFLTWVGNSTSSTQYRHQELGLVKWSQQTTGGSSYTFQQASGTPNDGYLYSQGRLTDIYYPSGRHVSYGYDAAGRVNTVGGYVTGVQYDPSGPPSQITFGNGVVEAIGFNNRLQTKSIEATKSGSLWKLENFYCASEGASCASNNGNVLSQKQTIGAVSWPTTYTYDGVNRLTAATETPSGATGWSHTFTYGNQYGNMTFVDSVGVVPSGLKCNSYNSANNRCNSAGFGYDGAGNLTSAAGRSMTYDAENRQATLIDGGTTQYLYDGEGRRVKKVSGGQTTTYVYDATGQLVAEYGGPAAYGPSCLTCYLTVDHLGSTRLVTDEQGAPVRRWDYTPFGWEINGSYGKRPQISGYVTSDGVQPKFTGKERDAETGLDYFGARYMSSAQGRFTSPDTPLTDQHPQDPQSWNLYSYVRNNPLRFNDPTGHFLEQAQDGQDGCGQHMMDCARVEPRIGPLPISRGNPTRERAVGAIKGLLTDVFELMRLGGAPDANVDQAEHFFGLSPSTQNEKFGGDLASIIGMLLPGGGERELVKTWELTATHELTKSKRAFNALKKSISEEGITETVKYVEYEGKKFIVDGHHRVEAAIQLGIREVPAQRVALPYKGYQSPIDLQ